MNIPWLDILAVALSFSLIKSAVTGELRSEGRGGSRVVATFNSAPLRLALMLVGWCLLAWSLIDVFRKFLS